MQILPKRYSTSFARNGYFSQIIFLLNTYTYNVSMDIYFYMMSLFKYKGNLPQGRVQNFFKGGPDHHPENLISQKKDNSRSGRWRGGANLGYSISNVLDMAFCVRVENFLNFSVV